MDANRSFRSMKKGGQNSPEEKCLECHAALEESRVFALMERGIYAIFRVGFRLWSRLWEWMRLY